MGLQNNTVNAHSTRVGIVLLLRTGDIGFNLQRHLRFVLVKTVAGHGELEILSHLDIIHLIGIVDNSRIIQQGHTLVFTRFDGRSVLNMMVEGELQASGQALHVSSITIVSQGWSGYHIDVVANVRKHIFDIKRHAMIQSSARWFALYYKMCCPTPHSGCEAQRSQPMSCPSCHRHW